MIMDGGPGVEIPVRGLTSSHEARVSYLVEVNADLQRELEWKDAGPDAAVEAAGKAELKREAPRRVREREALQQRKEDVEAQRDDFKRQLRKTEIAFASKESVDVDGCIRRAVAGGVSRIEQQG
jgi:hypothetical protein